MNEQVRKVKYEDISWKTAVDTITVLAGGENLDVAKSFAIKTIDDWQKEGKQNLVVDFKKFLLEKGIEL